MSTDLEQKPTDNHRGWLAVIEKFIDKGTPIEQLDKLLALQQQWERDQARKEFNIDFAAFKAEAPACIDRTGQVNFEGKSGGKVDYHHVELHEAVQILVPILSKHRLSHSWNTEQGTDGVISVTCLLEHSAGHSRSVTLRGMADASGSKNPIQAIGSAVYYLERYTFLAVLGIAQGRDTDGMNGGGLITDEQSRHLQDLFAIAGLKDTARFFKWAEITEWSQLPTAQYGKVESELKRKVAARKANGGQQWGPIGPPIMEGGGK